MEGEVEPVARGADVAEGKAGSEDNEDDKD